MTPSISSTPFAPIRDLDALRKRFIEREEGCSKPAAAFCLSDRALRFFWMQAIEAIRRSDLCERDGELFTSYDTQVWLGPWGVDIRHHTEWVKKRGGDRDESYEELHEGFEVVAVWDLDDKEQPELARLLNEFQASRLWQAGRE